MNFEPDPNDDRNTDEATPDAVDTMAMEFLTDETTPRPEVADAEIHDDDDPMVGHRVGAYRLMARIGGGGMGNVYLAERAEGFAQRVAVKLIRSGLDSEAIVCRFRNEIKLQAALGDHPNIAGLIDAETVGDGRPYFVMEYVDGVRIDEYCDAQRLDVPARLRLFAQVCDAVEFAHRHAVISPRPEAEQHPRGFGRGAEADRPRHRQADRPGSRGGRGAPLPAASGCSRPSTPVPSRSSASR